MYRTIAGAKTAASIAVKVKINRREVVSCDVFENVTGRIVAVLDDGAFRVGNLGQAVERVVLVADRSTKQSARSNQTDCQYQATLYVAIRLHVAFNPLLQKKKKKK